MRSLYTIILLGIGCAVSLAQVPPINPTTPGAAGAGVTPTPAPADIPNVPDVPPPPHKVYLSPDQARRIAQQEVLRQQELIYRANRVVEDARKAELAQDYPKAHLYYVTAVEAYGTGGGAALSMRRAAEGLTRVNLILCQRSLDAGDVKHGQELLVQAQKYDPTNEQVNTELAKITEALADPNSTKVLGNPAINRGFIKNINEVEQLFSEAEQFRRTGQWDEAETRLRKILAIDPYNIAATRFLERIQKQEAQYAEEARLENRDEQLRKLTELWYNSTRNPDIIANAQRPQSPIDATSSFALEQKLKSILITLDFSDFSIDQAITYLTSESKRLDDSPDHRGVPFVLEPNVQATAKKITLNLDNPLPLGEALRYICQIAGVKYKIQDSVILIVPYSIVSTDLVKRTFVVAPTFFANASGGGLTGSTLGAAAGNDAGGGVRPVFTLDTAPTPNSNVPETIQASLEARGILFPPGASAVYSQTTQMLEVTDSPDQMELLEELVVAGTAPVYRVKASTKFVEINQQDLNDLTFNTVLNTFNANLGGLFNGNNVALQPGGIPATAPQFHTSLPGVNALPNNGIDTLLGSSTPAENIFELRGFAGPSELNIIMSALAQKRSFDLLSDPFTLVKSSEGATLEATRIFPYPVTFDPPQAVQQANNNNNNGGNNNNNGVVALQLPAVIPTTPTEFKQRLVGVRLVARPQITPDNKNIELTLLPEVTDFAGFVNYGSPIFITDENNIQALMTANTLNQPVFNVRSINTHVLIHDGSTLILGGLIREDTQTVDDSVPFFGDIPLLGRLFKSKANRKTKRNLIVFVSADIYRNDGEKLNPPTEINAADVLTGRAGVTSSSQLPQ